MVSDHGQPPDPEQMFEYAKGWIELGDLLYEYTFSTIQDSLMNFGDSWQGDAASEIVPVVIMLQNLISDPKQDPTGNSMVSAARLCWNVGETINWYGIKLQQRLEKEKAQNIVDIILAVFGIIMLLIPFLPGAAAVLERMMLMTRFLVSVASKFVTNWVGRAALITLGSVIDGAWMGGAFTVVGDIIAYNIAYGVTGIDLEPDPKGIGMGVAFGAAGGFAFGPLGADGLAGPSRVPKGGELPGAGGGKGAPGEFPGAKGLPSPPPAEGFFPGQGNRLGGGPVRPIPLNIKIETVTEVAPPGSKFDLGPDGKADPAVASHEPPFAQNGLPLPGNRAPENISPGPRAGDNLLSGGRPEGPSPTPVRGGPGDPGAGTVISATPGARGPDAMPASRPTRSTGPADLDTATARPASHIDQVTSTPPVTARPTAADPRLAMPEDPRPGTPAKVSPATPPGLHNDPGAGGRLSTSGHGDTALPQPPARGDRSRPDTPPSDTGKSPELKWAGSGEARQPGPPVRGRGPVRQDDVVTPAVSPMPDALRAQTARPFPTPREAVSVVPEHGTDPNAISARGSSENGAATSTLGPGQKDPFGTGERLARRPANSNAVSVEGNPVTRPAETGVRPGETVAGGGALPDETVVRPPETTGTRQVFRANGDNGGVELVTLKQQNAGFTGEGRTLRGGGDSGVDPSGPRPDDGHTYFTVEPETGSRTPTYIRRDETVTQVQHATGADRRPTSPGSRVRDNFDSPKSQLTVFDPRKSTWDVQTVRHVDGDHLHAGHARPEPKGFQLLRKDKSTGKIDLLSYDRRPARGRTGELEPADPDFEYRAIDGPDAEWSDARAFGTPTRVETVVVPRREETVLSTKQENGHGALVHDDAGRWTAVRAPRPGEPIKAPEPFNSYFGAESTGGAGLRPVAVKNDAMQLVKVRSDGQVETGEFSAFSDDAPNLRLDTDGRLVNLLPSKIDPSELVVNPKTGDVAIKTTADTAGSAGSPFRPGGGPAKGSGGGGLGLRDTPAGASGHAATPRTIHLKEVTAGGKTSVKAESTGAPAVEPKSAAEPGVGAGPANRPEAEPGQGPGTHADQQTVTRPETATGTEQPPPARLTVRPSAHARPARIIRYRLVPGHAPEVRQVRPDDAVATTGDQPEPLAAGPQRDAGIANATPKVSTEPTAGHETEPSAKPAEKPAAVADRSASPAETSTAKTAGSPKAPESPASSKPKSGPDARRSPNDIPGPKPVLRRGERIDTATLGRHYETRLRATRVQEEGRTVQPEPAVRPQQSRITRVRFVSEARDTAREFIESRLARHGRQADTRALARHYQRQHDQAPTADPTPTPTPRPHKPVTRQELHEANMRAEIRQREETRRQEEADDAEWRRRWGDERPRVLDPASAKQREAWQERKQQIEAARRARIDAAADTDWRRRWGDERPRTLTGSSGAERNAWETRKSEIEAARNSREEADADREWQRRWNEPRPRQLRDSHTSEPIVAVRNLPEQRVFSRSQDADGRLVSSISADPDGKPVFVRSGTRPTLHLRPPQDGIYPVRQDTDGHVLSRVYAPGARGILVRGGPAARMQLDIVRRLHPIGRGPDGIPRFELRGIDDEPLRLNSTLRLRNPDGSTPFAFHLGGTWHPGIPPGIRQVFRENATSGDVELVTLVVRDDDPVPVPGAGRMVGDTASRPDDGNIYYEVDWTSGQPLRTQVQLNETVSEVTPAGGSRAPGTSPVAVFDSRNGSWTIRDVDHVGPGESRQDPAEPGQGDGLQMLRFNNLDGTVDLLTLQSAPLRTDAREGDPIDPDYHYRFLVPGQGDWSNARVFGTPMRIERVITPLGAVSNGALIRDGQGRWTAVRAAEASDTFMAEEPGSPFVYFAPPTPGGQSLTRIPVKRETIEIIKLSSDGRVSVSRFGRQQGDRPSLRIDHDGRLIEMLDGGVYHGDVVVDPASGLVTGTGRAILFGEQPDETIVTSVAPPFSDVPTFRSSGGGTPLAQPTSDVDAMQLDERADRFGTALPDDQAVSMAGQDRADGREVLEGNVDSRFEDGVQVEPDVERIADLMAKVTEYEPATGDDVLRAVFDLRFALGVKLKGATGDMPGAHTGSAWLFDGHDGAGVGWKLIGSSRDVRVAVRTAGVGGITLFASASPDIATFVHYGRDYVMRVFEVDVQGTYRMTNLDQYTKTQVLPQFVSPIDQCGEVHA